MGPFSNCSVAFLITVSPGLAYPAAREAAPVLTAARTSTCTKASKGRIFRRTFIRLVLYQRVGLVPSRWSSRDLGTERTQTELPIAILITADTPFLEKKIAIIVVATWL